MRHMTMEERKVIEHEITEIMIKSTGSDYARYILRSENDETNNTFMNDVVDNVLETSAWEEEGYYNDDDIRLAIGRIFMERMNIDY